MGEDETFMEFYSKLNDIVNSMWGLGKKLPEPDIVDKILRSLPIRFSPKVTAIGECRNTDLMRVEDLGPV